MYRMRTHSLPVQMVPAGAQPVEANDRNCKRRLSASAWNLTTTLTSRDSQHSALSPFLAPAYFVPPTQMMLHQKV
ncbi:mCG147753 [Mus musculus]|nr:mCG147753 [Mus musculus]